MSVTDLIDPEELPFTEDELLRAARTFMPEEGAQKMAAHLAWCGPGAIDHRRERRRQWKQGGIANADQLLEHGWVYPEQLLPALAALSPAVASRVEELRLRLANQPTPERFAKP